MKDLDHFSNSMVTLFRVKIDNTNKEETIMLLKKALELVEDEVEFYEYNGYSLYPYFNVCKREMNKKEWEEKNNGRVY